MDEGGPTAESDENGMTRAVATAEDWPFVPGQRKMTGKPKCKDGSGQANPPHSHLHAFGMNIKLLTSKLSVTMGATASDYSLR